MRRACRSPPLRGGRGCLRGSWCSPRRGRGLIRKQNARSGRVRGTPNRQYLRVGPLSTVFVFFALYAACWRYVRTIRRVNSGTQTSRLFTRVDSLRTSMLTGEHRIALSLSYYRLVLAQTPLHGALFECCSVLYFSHLSRDFSYTKNLLFPR